MKAGQVWLVGPSNAIEGYVPQRELIAKPSPSKNSQDEGDIFVNNEMNFTTAMLMNDEYIAFQRIQDDYKSRQSCSGSKLKEVEGKGIRKDFEDKCVISGSSSASRAKDSTIIELPSAKNIYQNGLVQVVLKQRRRSRLTR
ncbi:hypothetical protein DITRI_Ditri14bG0088600 [Diplodiscus trichospermus]